MLNQTREGKCDPRQIQLVTFGSVCLKGVLFGFRISKFLPFCYNLYAKDKTWWFLLQNDDRYEFQTVKHVLACSVRCVVMTHCYLTIVWTDVRVINGNLSYFKHRQDIIISVFSKTKNEHYGKLIFPGIWSSHARNTESHLLIYLVVLFF